METKACFRYGRANISHHIEKFQSVIEDLRLEYYLPMFLLLNRIFHARVLHANKGNCKCIHDSFVVKRFEPVYRRDLVGSMGPKLQLVGGRRRRREKRWQCSFWTVDPITRMGAWRDSPRES